MAKPEVSVGLNLFGLTVEVHNALSLFGRRGKLAGPFVLVERLQGKALETGEDIQDGWQPWLGNLNGGVGQRWIFEKSPFDGEISIRSDLHGFALDCTLDARDHAPLTLWHPHGAAHQRWRLRRTPSSRSWYIGSAKDDRVIDTGRLEDRSTETKPWMWEQHGALWQQFLILPIG